MEAYLKLLKNVIDNGIEETNDRTGIGTKYITGATLKWDLDDGFPIVTTRKVAFRIAFEETMFFLRGETDTKKLEEKNIYIWSDNTSREFLDKQGLHDLPVGSIGTGYSHQWRNFGGDVGKSNGVDQVSDMLESMKTNPTSRRHLVSAWNPQQLDGTPLPPCHIMQMYTIDTKNNKLHSSFVMRSSDLYHGLPYNIMGYAWLNVLFSKYLGLEPGTLTYFGHNAHIYNHQVDVVKQQLERTPKKLPKIEILKDVKTIDDIFNMEFSDVDLVGYDPHPALPRVPMAV